MTKLSPADWFTVFICLQYIVASGLYLKQGQGWVALYWIAAALLNFAVIKMKA